MKRLKLIELLSSFDVDEVFIEIEDWEHDIEVEERDEVFDGFDEVFPAHLVLKPKK